MATEAIDIASYQHPNGAPINWPAVAASGRQAVFVKLSEGHDYVNPYAAQDCADARQAGLHVYGYHFARPENNPAAIEAALFLAQVQVCGPLEGLALDLEDGRQLGPDELAFWCNDFHAAVNLRWLYTNHDMWDFLGGRVAWGDRFLWFADPSGTGTPPQTDVVQYGQGPVPGIEGLCDLDRLLFDFPAPVETVSGVPYPLGGADPASLAVLRVGATGPLVQDAQYLLCVHRQSIAVDGVFGPQTEAATRYFQQAAGLQVDGVIGVHTWAALLVP